MLISDCIGYTAATFTTVAFLPQAIKVIKTNETDSISLWMYIIFTLGVSFWLIYGVLQNIYPIIIANAITLIFAFIILIYKIKNSKK